MNSDPIRIEHKKNLPGRVLLNLLLFSIFLCACSVLPRTSYPEQTIPASMGALEPDSVPGHAKPYRVNGSWYKPISHARGFEEKGIASWYGEKFHGRKTSSGETYNMYGISAAHKTLPMGTYVRVQNMNNNRTLDVRINDRGPFVGNRIIDLSYGAAKQLGVVGPGTAPVKITALGAPVSQPAGNTSPTAYQPMDYYSGDFTFQVGAFAEKANAERLVQKLAHRYKNAHMTPFFDGTRTFYRVRVGHTADLEEADTYEQHLKENGFPETFIVAE
jgi:rare lipoprotein A